MFISDDNNGIHNMLYNNIVTNEEELDIDIHGGLTTNI